MTNPWRYQEGIQKAGEYAHLVLCCNCGESIYIYITKGVRIRDITASITCENCGVCQTGKFNHTS